MAKPNNSALILSSESSEKSGAHMEHSSTNWYSPLQGPVAILWDIENCPVPSDVRPEEVAGNIRMALRLHPIIKGAVTVFSAYGDFNAFPRRLREGCQRTGVKLIDVPNGRKDAADKAILVDMFLFALDNHPPSSIMLISGDVDFAPALHILGQRGYTVILVIPSGVGVSSALCNAGRFVWDWPSVARGEGFVPPTKTLGPPDIAGYLMGCQINDNNPDNNNINIQNDEEAIVYRGVSESFYTVSSSAISIPLRSSQSLPPSLNEPIITPCDQNDDLMWVQPGDVNGLKGQLVKLLELHGGCLPLARVPAEYQRMYLRPLYISEYGATKLVMLFKKMADAMTVDGKGQRKFVYLRNFRAGPSAAKKDKKGKGIEIITGTGSSDEFSDDDDESMIGGSIEQFKYELQEILVSYSCRIFLGCFEDIYRQRYKKPLELGRFGVNNLEELFEKVKDVAVLQEEPINKRKFLVAAAVGS